MLNIIYLNKLKSLAAGILVAPLRPRRVVLLRAAPRLQPFYAAPCSRAPLRILYKPEDAAQCRPNFILYLCLPATPEHELFRKALWFLGGVYTGRGNEGGYETSLRGNRALDSLESAISNGFHKLRILG